MPLDFLLLLYEGAVHKSSPCPFSGNGAYFFRLYADVLFVQKFDFTSERELDASS